jgi:hypothetical protein
VELVAAIFVAGGVVGEFWYEQRISIVDSCVQQTDNARAVLLEKQAGEAKTLADKAERERIALQTRMLDVFGPRRLTAAQSRRITHKLSGMKGALIDVYVLAVGNPYTPGEAEDSIDIARSAVRALRTSPANADAAGWILDDCHGAGAMNVVVAVRPDLVKDLAADSKIGAKLIEAFTPEIGTDPQIEPMPPICLKFSDLEKSKPNKRPHGIAAISITIGSRIQPILTREMLEPRP